MAALMRSVASPSDAQIAWMQTGVVVPAAGPQRSVKRKKRHIYHMPRQISMQILGEIKRDVEQAPSTRRRKRSRFRKALHVRNIHKATELTHAERPFEDRFHRCRSE